MNQICSMTSLTNLSLTTDPLVCTLFNIFLYDLTSPLLVFWGMTFLHQQDLSPNVVNSLHSFGAQIPDFPSKLDRWETEEAMASNPTKIQQRGLKDECLTESTLRTWLEIGGKKREARYVEKHPRSEHKEQGINITWESGFGVENEGDWTQNRETKNKDSI